MRAIAFAAFSALFVIGAAVAVSCDQGSGQQGVACVPACSAGQECVEGFCRDLTCRPPCRKGRACINGYCLRTCDPSSGSGCGMSERCCPDLHACVDVRSDFYNCGSCGGECDPMASSHCVDSRCVCRGWSTTPCEEGWGCCTAPSTEDRFECKDLLNDPENCGECGHSCGDLQCEDGSCRCSDVDRCPDGQACCSDGCHDLAADPDNCGECGTLCETGEDCCGGECVNTLVDTGNCGGCTLGCGSGEECCIGTCTNVDSDPFNCGECLTDCGAGGRCSGGECQ